MFDIFFGLLAYIGLFTLIALFIFSCVCIFSKVTPKEYIWIVFFDKKEK